MNAENFLYKRFDLKPVSESDLQAVKDEFIKYKRDDTIRFQSFFWAAVAIFSVWVFFSLKPGLIILSLVVSVVLIGGYISDVGGAKDNFRICSSPLTADELPPKALDMMREDPELKSEIVALMKQQGGVLFVYQVGAFDVEKVKRQRNAVKQAIEGAVA